MRTNVDASIKKLAAQCSDEIKQAVGELTPESSDLVWQRVEVQVRSALVKLTARYNECLDMENAFMLAQLFREHCDKHGFTAAEILEEVDWV